jgi:hypothetical protein
MPAISQSLGRQPNQPRSGHRHAVALDMICAADQCHAFDNKLTATDAPSVADSEHLLNYAASLQPLRHNGITYLYASHVVAF